MRSLFGNYGKVLLVIHAALADYITLNVHCFILIFAVGKLMFNSQVLLLL